MNKILSVSIIFVAAVLGGCIAATPSTGQPLLVHEWGTFTSFQDRVGTTIGGINVDDEPVPDFVHRLGDLPIWTPGSRPASWSQGAPRCHPDVTLRLETPVVYFYPESDAAAREPVDFHASFLGGWLTEYFPAARAEAPRFPGPLTGATRGRLEWSGLRLGTTAPAGLPQTSERVWLAPRKVRASTVTTADGRESEKYLFYRGVAHLDAPLVVRQRDNHLTIAPRVGDSPGHLNRIPRGWMVRVFPDGRLWYSAFDATTAVAGAVTMALPLQEAGTPPTTLKALQAALREALIEQGLFPDEAQAMLETWELSYFKSEGLRLFFLLPRHWIDHYLPISVSTPAQITRVMLGRIELMSPHQQDLLAQLYALPDSEFDRRPIYHEVLDEDRSGLSEEERAEWEKTYRSMLERGHTHAEFYAAFGREVPEGLKLYEALGRFRDALLGHELRQEKDATKRRKLQKFIRQYSACLPPDLGRRGALR